MTKLYKKFLVGPTDKFDPENFQGMIEEIQMINEKTQTVPSAFKADIIISFLNDHSIQNDWILANPELVALVNSGTLFNGNTESLFDSCRNNATFRDSLKIYLTKELTGTLIPK